MVEISDIVRVYLKEKPRKTKEDNLWVNEEGHFYSNFGGQFWQKNHLLVLSQKIKQVFSDN